MKFYGQAEAAGKQIIDLFATGNVPSKLATVFIKFDSSAPCFKWSWNNRLLCAINGTSDARGFRQWESVGRFVRSGAKAFHILAPCMMNLTEKDEQGN